MGVNVHGQDFNAGMLIETVQSFRLLLASGEVVNVSRSENAELFGFAIGGYGLAGIIVDVTLALTDDVQLTRTVQEVSTPDMGSNFYENIQSNKDAQFYSARFSLRENDYLEKALVISYTTTDAQASSVPSANSWFGNLFMRNLFSLAQSSSVLRKLRFSLESLLLGFPVVVSRNSLMGRSVEALPQDSARLRYILQEYFIPYDKLSTFMEEFGGIVKEYNVDLLNITARHVRGNDESLLSWSPQDSCALVLYIAQPCNDDAYEKAVVWTRKLIDVALKHDGSFYLPYQYLATTPQVALAYKKIPEFLELKKKYDPNGVFRNKMYEHYLESYSS